MVFFVINHLHGRQKLNRANRSVHARNDGGRRGRQGRGNVLIHCLVEMSSHRLRVGVVGIASLGLRYLGLLLPVLIEVGDMGIGEGSGGQEEEGEEEQPRPRLHHTTSLLLFPSSSTILFSSMQYQTGPELVLSASYER